MTAKKHSHALGDEDEEIKVSTDIIQWYGSSDEALKAIKEFELKTGTKFIKMFQHRYDTFKSRIRWDANTNVPYIITGSGRLECQFGKDRDKERKEQRKKQSLQNILQGLEPNRKRPLCSRRCKKLDCEAVISIMETIKFPEFKIDDLSKSKRTVVSKKLRELLQNDNNTLVQEYACSVTYPSNDSHSGHAVIEAPPVAAFHESLTRAIDELVNQGLTNVKDIKKKLKRFVQDVLFKNTDPPPLTDRRFYPSVKDLRKYLNLSPMDTNANVASKEDHSEMWIGEIDNLLLEIETMLGSVRAEKELWQIKESLRDILADLSKFKHQPSPFQLSHQLPSSMERNLQESIFDHLSGKRFKHN